MTEQEKKLPRQSLPSRDKKTIAEKSRATKEEIMTATKRGIERYRDVLKNLAKR